MRLMDYWNPICLVICVVMVVLTATSFPLVIADPSSRSPLGMVCLSMLFAGQIICTIMFVSVFLDRRISIATLFFMCLITMEYLYLSLEIVHWEAKEIYLSTPVLNAIHHVEHMILPVMLFLFINYQMRILKYPEEDIGRIQRILLVSILAELALVLINVPTNLLFSMDGLNVSNGPLRVTLFIPPLFMTAVSIWMTVKFSAETRHRVTMLSCLAIPVVVAGLSFPLHIPSFTAVSILAVFLLLYGGIYVDRGTRLAKYEAEIMEQKVSMMVARIEPDFLSESLESIMLMDGNPPETLEAIGEFRKYLSENVNTISQKAPIPFSTELAHVESYVRLEKLRFKDKLNVVFDIEDEEFELPAMTLQMIVENAIKHGITQKEAGGTVTISTRLTDDAHIITITDDGVGFDVSVLETQDTSHIGIENLSSRLNSMMGGSFEIESEIGKGTVAKVILPR